MDKQYMTSVLELQRLLARVEIRAMILGGEEIVVDVASDVARNLAVSLGLQRDRWWLLPFARQWSGTWQGYSLTLRGYGKV